jgi:hypothetical protein
MINLPLLPNIFFISRAVKEICFSNAKLRDSPNALPKSSTSLSLESEGISMYITPCPTSLDAILVNVVFPVPYSPQTT